MRTGVPSSRNSWKVDEALARTHRKRSDPQANSSRGGAWVSGQDVHHRDDLVGDLAGVRPRALVDVGVDEQLQLEGPHVAGDELGDRRAESGDRQLGEVGVALDRVLLGVEEHADLRPVSRLTMVAFSRAISAVPSAHGGTTAGDRSPPSPRRSAARCRAGDGSASGPGPRWETRAREGPRGSTTFWCRRFRPRAAGQHSGRCGRHQQRLGRRRPAGKHDRSGSGAAPGSSPSASRRAGAFASRATTGLAGFDGLRAASTACGATEGRMTSRTGIATDRPAPRSPVTASLTDSATELRRSLRTVSVDRSRHLSTHRGRRPRAAQPKPPAPRARADLVRTGCAARACGDAARRASVHVVMTPRSSAR